LSIQLLVQCRLRIIRQRMHLESLPLPQRHSADGQGMPILCYEQLLSCLPGYLPSTSVCSAVACPAHSSGASVGAGCSCASGFQGTITASGSSPYTLADCLSGSQCSAPCECLNLFGTYSCLPSIYSVNWGAVTSTGGGQTLGVAVQSTGTYADFPCTMTFWYGRADLSPPVWFAITNVFNAAPAANIVTFTGLTSPGYGADLFVAYQDSITSLYRVPGKPFTGWTMDNDEGLKFSFLMTAIDAASLNLALTSLSIDPATPVWLTITGSSFGSALYADKTAVKYTSASLVEYSCIFTVDNSGADYVTSTIIKCRTSTGEAGGNYHITVNVDGRTLLPGTDTPTVSGLLLRNRPVSVAAQPSLARRAHSTAAGVIITVSGTSFFPPITATVDGRVCPNVVATSFSGECTLPAGTGRRARLAVANIVGNVPTYSTPLSWLGYAAPQVTTLLHTGCETAVSGLTNCPRSGGGCSQSKALECVGQQTVSRPCAHCWLHLAGDVHTPGGCCTECDSVAGSGRRRQTGQHPLP